MKRKILVVDDNSVNQQLLSKILGSEYDILEACNGKEALCVLNEWHEEISAVLLDLVMPELDGYGVLEAIHADSRLSKVPVIVTTANTEQGSEVKALSFGANDFIIKPYNPSVIKHRLWNTINLRETAAIVNAAERDELTGVYNKTSFYKKAEEILHSDRQTAYDMLCCDIERFKLINELFGEQTGDGLLVHVAKLLSQNNGQKSICGRIGADKFALLTPHRERYHSEDFEAELRAVNSFPVSININISHGIYVIDDIDLPVSTVCDRALTASNSIKGKYGVHFVYYDDGFMKKLLSEQFILDNMKTGIRERQFVVYYQPKYSLLTERIIGAEALVRWIHPERGFMSPGEFIPLFEKNGFITDLDIFVWETVCCDMRKWMDNGHEAVPISVNVSRADIYNPEIADILTHIVEKYDISPKLLHLEITETAYTENSKQLIEAVEKLTALGFPIEMDDFGSGYSSLNMLSDLPINILKLDMSLIREIANERKLSVLKTVMYLAGELGLPVVAEGVETGDQVKALRNMSCAYAQGYYYAKPIQREKFEESLG